MPPVFRSRTAPTPLERDRDRDRRRDEAEQRRWYKTARWQKLKVAVHERDSYLCRATNVICLGKYPADDSPVADHVIEPNGDADLFWDMDNIRTVSKAFHDGERQREQIAQRGRGAVRKFPASQR